MDLDLVNNYGLLFDSNPTKLCIPQSLSTNQYQSFLWASILEFGMGKLNFLIVLIYLGQKMWLTITNIILGENLRFTYLIKILTYFQSNF